MNKKLETLRVEILRNAREPTELLKDVVNMREKMRAQLVSKAGDAGFDLKHDRGGIVDINLWCNIRF